ncbi:MAG: DNA topoisomerase IV subunit A [Alphaproteobacteria bacterium]
MTDLPGEERIRPTPFVEALSERYLSYAVSTIVSRSLPDVRDGLKPVHRRLLYAMRLLRLDPRSGFKKCARVVGDVIGKYHPHGEVAVYDALVRLAQDFAARYPLVEGQGNFGNVDGDNAAAMRYTEARLTDIAEALLEGIDEDTVEFRTTYDGEEREPLVLPAAFPNLLANGANGVAVGMATSIPPHNAVELCTALLHLLKTPRAQTEELVELIPGPDFPTGGIIVEPHESIVDAYATGRGGFRLRARWCTEDLGRGKYQIVVTEIPYQVQKVRLVEKVADLMESKKLSWLADVIDESTEDIRLIFVPRARNIDVNLLMETLFRSTELEVRIPLNLNVLDKDRVPRVMSLRSALSAFLDHRFVVLRRRSTYRRIQIETRLEVLEGYLIAYADLDAVIKVIRDADTPEKEMRRRWKLSEAQVNAILSMRLRQLRKLDQLEIRKEYDDLTIKLGDLIKLLKSKARQRTTIEVELKQLNTRLSESEVGKRRTEFATVFATDEAPLLEVIVEREPVTVLCSQKGWIRTAKNHLTSDVDLKFKEGDQGRFTVHAHTTDRLLIFATNGRFYTLSCDKLPGGRGFGEPVRMMIELENDHDVVALLVHKPGQHFLLAASDGRGFLVNEDDVLTRARAGKQILNVADDIKAVACVPANGDTVAVVGENHKLLLFGIDEVSVQPRGRGVILQRYRDGGLRDVKVFQKANGLSWRFGERTRTFTDTRPWLSKRGQAGRLAPTGFPKSNKFGIY